MRRLGTVTLVVVLAGCGGGDGGDDDVPDAASDADSPLADAAAVDGAVVRMMIGPGGGTLTTADGVQLEIPAGALAATTEISVLRSSGPAQGSASAIYELGPDGTAFAEPITVTLPYDRAALGAAAPETLMLATRMNGQWSSSGYAMVDTESGQVTGYVGHFSTWALVPAPPGASCRLDYGCFTSCCGSQPPDLCCSMNRDACHCAHNRSFRSWVGCYAGCVRTPQATNFANSPCMKACCQAQGGVQTRGACMLATRAKTQAALSCARACTGPGDTGGMCERGDLAFDACSWQWISQQVLGQDCPQNGVNAQQIRSDFRAVFPQDLASQTAGGPAALHVTGGSLGSTAMTIDLQCVGSSTSGSMTGTWGGTRFDGTWSFGGYTSTFYMTPNWPLTP